MEPNPKFLLFIRFSWHFFSVLRYKNLHSVNALYLYTCTTGGSTSTLTNVTIELRKATCHSRYTHLAVLSFHQQHITLYPRTLLQCQLVVIPSSLSVPTFWTLVLVRTNCEDVAIAFRHWIIPLVVASCPLNSWFLTFRMYVRNAIFLVSSVVLVGWWCELCHI